MENGNNRYVLLNDDLGLFRTLVKNAIAELWLRIGRMSKAITQAISHTEEVTRLNLEVSSNHDDNMLFSMGSFIEQFIDSWVLKQWYERNQVQIHAQQCEHNAELALSRIVTIVHYRKKAIKRPVNPIF